MTQPFIIYALPRSRTAWLSDFLTYGDWICQHEMAVMMRSLDDVRALFNHPKIGSIETAAIYGRALIRHLIPDIKEVVILRNVEEAVESMLRVDIDGVGTYDEEVVRKSFVRADKLLRRAAQDSHVLTVKYEDLDKEETCKAIFEYCLPYYFDKAWWEKFRNQNIQMNVKEHLLYYFCNKDKVEAFKRHCKSELRKLVKAGLIPARVV